MKIIILEHEPFQKRKIDHYFIDKFTNDGFVIEYWGLHKIVSYLNEANYGYEEYEDFVEYFHNMDDLLLKLSHQDIDKTILIVELWYTIQTKNIFKLIHDKNIKWVKIDYYINPSKALSACISRIEKIKLAAKNRNLVDKALQVFKNKFLPLTYNTPNIFFHTGTNTKFLPNSKKYVSLDYYDITTYENLVFESNLDFKYIVFLDIMLVDHPDIARSGYWDILDKEIYYFKLNKIFEFIEKELGLPIVIASHPKANYSDEFGERLLINNQTAQLVKFSEMVLTHGSLSVCYALLSNKKIAYIDIQDLFNENLFLRNIQESLRHSSSVLNSIVIDENTNSGTLNGNVDTETYEKFIIDYFRKNSDNNLENFDIIKQSIFNVMNETK